MRLYNSGRPSPRLISDNETISEENANLGRENDARHAKWSVEYNDDWWRP